MTDEYELTEQEFEDELERRAQAWLGMSFVQFLEAQEAGILPDLPGVQHLLLLARAREN